jgi:hypothetical protein
MSRVRIIAGIGITTEKFPVVYIESTLRNTGLGPRMLVPSLLLDGKYVYSKFSPIRQPWKRILIEPG